MSRAENGRVRRAALWGLLLLCLTGAGLLAFLAFRQAVPLLEADAGYAEIRIRYSRRAQTGMVENLDWEALLEAYPNIVGWIFAPDMDIDYPVMQGEDNDYYLTHMPDGSYSAGGSIFLDARNDPGLSDPLVIVYGHNMPQGTMFSPLVGYRGQAFYLEHPTLRYYTPEAVYDVQVFASGQLAGADGSFLWEYETPENRERWLRERLAESDIVCVPKPLPQDQVMVLATCSQAKTNVPRYLVYAIFKKAG